MTKSQTLHFYRMLLFATFVVSATASQADNTKPYLLGVFPFVSQAQLEPRYSHLAGELGSSMNRTFSYRSARDMRSFISDVEDEKFELIFTQPFDYPRVAKQAGYLPLAASNIDLTALFVVRDDANIKTLSDLRGKTIATLPPIAAVTILGRIELDQAGLKEDKDYWFEFTKKHDNCLQLLVIKRVDACITADYPLKEFRDNVYSKVSPIHISQHVIRPSFFVHKRVPASEQEEILNTIKTWTTSYGLYKDEKDAIYRRVKDSDYDAVTRILENSRNH